jgi:hypothetical protein
LLRCFRLLFAGLLTKLLRRSFVCFGNRLRLRGLGCSGLLTLWIVFLPLLEGRQKLRLAVRSVGEIGILGRNGRSRRCWT